MEILIIEDTPQVAHLLTTALKKWGHTVRIAETGEQALSIVKGHFFDLIITDIFLPDTMAYDLIPRLKEQWSGMDIITMTGHNSFEVEEKTRSQGILYYMVKPVDLTELNSIIEHLDKSREKNNHGPASHRP